MLQLVLFLFLALVSRSADALEAPCGGEPEKITKQTSTWVPHHIVAPNPNDFPRRGWFYIAAADDGPFDAPSVLSATIYDDRHVSIATSTEHLGLGGRTIVVRMNTSLPPNTHLRLLLTWSATEPAFEAELTTGTRWEETAPTMTFASLAIHSQTTNYWQCQEAQTCRCDTVSPASSITNRFEADIALSGGDDDYLAEGTVRLRVAASINDLQREDIIAYRSLGYASTVTFDAAKRQYHVVTLPLPELEGSTEVCAVSELWMGGALRGMSEPACALVSVSPVIERGDLPPGSTLAPARQAQTCSSSGSEWMALCALLLIQRWVRKSMRFMKTRHSAALASYH